MTCLHKHSPTYPKALEDRVQRGQLLAVPQTCRAESNQRHLHAVLKPEITLLWLCMVTLTADSAQLCGKQKQSNDEKMNQHCQTGLNFLDKNLSFFLKSDELPEQYLLQAKMRVHLRRQPAYLQVCSKKKLEEGRLCAQYPQVPLPLPIRCSLLPCSRKKRRDLIAAATLSERVSTFRDAMASYPSQTRHLHRLQHPGFLCVPHVTISELRGVQWCTHEDGRVLVEMEGDGKQGWLRVLE